MNSKIKLSAREAISGSYIKILPLTVLIFFMFLSFSFCNAAMNYCFENKIFLAVFSVLTLLVFVALISPIKLILQIRFLALTKGRGGAFMPAISYSDMLKACELNVKLFLLKFFWLAVFESLPLASTLIFISFGKRNVLSLRAAYAVFTGIICLAVIGIFFYFVAVQRYSKSWFFLAGYGDFTAAEAIKESIRKTQEKHLEIFFFKLSFAPWLLLCIGILPALFVVPYYKQSVTCYFLSR